MYVSKKDLETIDSILQFADENRFKIPRYSDGFAESVLHLKSKMHKQRKHQEEKDKANKRY